MAYLLQIQAILVYLCQGGEAQAVLAGLAGGDTGGGGGHDCVCYDC